MLGNRPSITDMRGVGRAPVRGAVAPTQASIGDTLRVVATALTPVIARGVIIRRPRVVAAAERMDADHRLVSTLQRMRARYGSAPLRLRVLRALPVLEANGLAQLHIRRQVAVVFPHVSGHRRLRSSADDRDYRDRLTRNSFT